MRTRPPSPAWCGLLLALLVACGGPPADDAASGPVPLVVGPEDMVEVQQGSIASGPRLTGTLEAAQRAAIRAETGGQVQAVEVELGQAVTRGQVLARIEGNVAREGLAFADAALRAAEQDLANARRELERATRLVEAGALAPRDQETAQSLVIAAEARVEQARAQRATARDQVGATTIQAPMAGVVSERAVGQGDIVAPGSPLFTVIDPTSLRLEGAVPAEALAELEVGTVVAFEVQGAAGRRFEGTVERVAPAVDASSRLIPILVAVPNPEGRLVAGLFAEGRVATRVHEGLVVPADALGEEGGQPTVTRIRDGAAEKVGVEVGIRDTEGEQVEILGGLAAGDRVLLGAAREVPAGTPVQVRADAAPAAATPAAATPAAGG